MGAIITNTNRVMRAINHYSLTNLYLGIGQTSVWTSEPTPDVPTVDDYEINELIYIKRIDSVQLVKLNAASGALEVGGLKYDIVPLANAYTESAMSVYYTVNIDYSDVGATSFRQIGILHEPEDVSGIVSGADYLAASILDQGHMIYINNTSVIARTTGQTESFQVIIDF